jgi:hypothetical protein
MGQNCESLPKEFISYSDAMSQIYKNHFTFSDERRENIKTISEKKNVKLVCVCGNYYSCDNKTGYAIFIFINGDIFIYEKVPMKIWIEYKKCISTELYYKNNILTKYRCILKQLGPDGL